MNAHVERSAKNLLALSEEKTAFDKAILEWQFEGNITDHEAPTEMCELCEQEGVRYHFEIRNALGNVLQVGSTCIDKFDIQVLDEAGNEVLGNKKAYLANLVKRRHRVKVMDALFATKHQGKLADYSKADLDEHCYVCIVQENSWDFRVLRYVFKRFEEEGMAFDPKAFSIPSDNSSVRTDLLRLKRIQFERIRGALSKKQRDLWLSAKGKGGDKE